MGGEYGVFIWSAYGFTGTLVALLIAWTALDYRAQAKALARLEAAHGSGPRD